METNNFEKRTVQWGIILIIIFVILLLIAGVSSHILISNEINICDHLKLHKLKHQIMDGASITFLTTIIMVLLVSVGIYFLRNAEQRLEQIGKANRNTRELYSEFEKTMKKANKDMNENIFVLGKLSSSFKLHIPIAYIYTTTSIWTEKKLKNAEGKKLLMSFFYKINRQIHFINHELNELKKHTIKLDHDLKQMLTINYLEDSINNVEEIISDNKLNWEVANKTLGDLKDVQEKIGSFEND